MSGFPSYILHFTIYSVLSGSFYLAIILSAFGICTLNINNDIFLAKFEVFSHYSSSIISEDFNVTAIFRSELMTAFSAKYFILLDFRILC